MAGNEGTNLALNLPAELGPGVFADVAMVWHNEHGFTLDFIAQLGPATPETETVQAQVVARVRVPPTVIFQIARAIADNVANYERSYGSISSGGPEHSPDE